MNPVPKILEVGMLLSRRLSCRFGLDTPIAQTAHRILRKVSQPPEDLRRRGAKRVITKAKALSVSPVLYPAGIGTRTIAVKYLREAKWIKQETDAAFALYVQNEIAVSVAEHGQMGKQLRALRLVA